MQVINTLLALDIGDARTGVAVANTIAQIASPLTTLECPIADLPPKIADLVTQQQASVLVIGLPRGLHGQDTDQTKHIQACVDQIRSLVSVPIYLQDEALTSQKAEDELRGRGKPYGKGDIDALAATYILQDYLTSHAKELV
jgi:putative Holliday junction resolvase